MFEIDRSKIPSVRFQQSWAGSAIYEVGSWSLEEAEDNIEHAEEAVYAWIAWYEFLRRRAENGKSS
jgi:hypothetical protein